MKTLCYFFYTFGVIIGAALLDGQHVDFGAVAAALAVAVMFAMALHDAPRARRPLPRPAVARFRTHPMDSLDLAA